MCTLPAIAGRSWQVESCQTAISVCKCDSW